MNDEKLSVLILTTAHWPGDPRLNRHVRYLQDTDVDAGIIAFQSVSRVGRIVGVLKAAVVIWRERPYAVILPDPELFVVGSLAARVRGTRAVVDIHEDYAKAARGRKWIPDWLKPIASALARVNTWLGKAAAHVTVVAAPELADAESVLVQNTPDPADFEVMPERNDPPTVVYVGDVTEARGALAMAELSRRMPDIRFVVVGNASQQLAEEMARIGSPGQLHMLGRLPHEQAWRSVKGATAGLSLLEPLPAYRDAVATKLWEYCAAGIPPVVSALAGQQAFVEPIDEALAIDGVDDAELVIRRLVEDLSWADEISARSRKMAEEAWKTSRPDRALQAAVVPRPITFNVGPGSEN